MEIGTLSIIETKSGKLIVRVTFTKSDGKQGIIDASFWVPTKEHRKYDGTSCEFQRDKNLIIKIKTEDGKVFEKEQVRVTPNSEGKRESGKPLSFGEEVKDSYNPELTFLPKDTKECLAHISPDNFALKWQKAARFMEGPTSDKDKFIFFKRDRKGENFEIIPNYGNLNFQQIAKRELLNARVFLGANQIREIVFNTQWRMVQGLGLESVYETSMTLHHIYGIPYIPASALKGVVRSWIISNSYNDKEEVALSDPRFCDWFGCPGELMKEEKDKSGKTRKQRYPSYYKEARKGALVFFDAYPLDPPQTKVDVMNPHYGPYYSDKIGKNAPADYYNPIPVFFLTVENTSFQFIMGGNKETLVQTLGNKTILDWLKDALENHGIGAKTAVGYGYFKPT